MVCFLASFVIGTEENTIHVHEPILHSNLFQIRSCLGNVKKELGRLPKRNETIIRYWLLSFYFESNHRLICRSLTIKVRPIQKHNRRTTLRITLLLI